MPLPETIPDKYLPPAPETSGELGLPQDFVTLFILRRLATNGQSTPRTLARTMGLSMSAIDTIIKELMSREEIATVGMSPTQELRYGATAKGKQRHLDESGMMSYSAYMPVNLIDYTRLIESQRRQPELSKEGLKAAYTDLVISDELFGQIGPAMTNTRPALFWGPPGTGKTSVAERIIRLTKDAILIPHTVYVEGAIIKVFDPEVHIAAANQPEGLDSRWVLCRRPAVIRGGELTMSGVNLQWEPDAGVYRAPAQMIANNGVLIVDDFGRQQITASELLNRWIYPMSRDKDILTLNTGLTFEVPFDCKVVFSTNMDPKELGGGDEAFLRRIPNKVYIGEITAEQFDQVLDIVKKIRKVEVSPQATAHLRARIRELSPAGDLRPYLPMDFLDIFIAIADYEGWEYQLTKGVIDRIAPAYFAQSGGKWATAASGS